MRVFVAIILLQFCWCLPVEKAGPPPKIALDFMKQYGYLKADKESSAALYTEEGLSEAIKTVQRFGALNETGRLDKATLKLMASPRCGNADVVPGKRTKRFTFGSSGWNKRHITYYLANWSSRLGEETVARLIGKALSTWGAYGSLKFSRQSTPDADIIVSFARGAHNDAFPFDGPGYVLAHAYFPNSGSAISGDIHFDDDEEWVESTPQELLESGTDFYSVALHELGHSLGLGHSNDQQSIMFPYYRGDDASSLQLGQDDILAMYQLYIARPIQETTESTTESTTRRTRPYNTRPPREPPRTRTPELPTRTTQTEHSTRIYTKNPYTQSTKTTEPTIYTRTPTYRTTETERVRTSFPSTIDPFFTKDSTRSTFSTSVPSTNYPTRTTWYTNSPPVRKDHTYREKPTTSSPNNRFPYSTTTEITTRRNTNRPVSSGTTNRRTPYSPSIGTQTPTLPPPNICQGHFDSVANLRGELFFFKGEYIWRLQDRNRMVPGYPVLLRQMFPHFPGNVKKVDAAYQRPDGNMVLFTGDQYWVYDGSAFTENSPRFIHDYGIPLGIGGIDAVQTWGRNGKTYLYKNDRFWRYDETSKTADSEYPAHMEIWRGIPTNLDAAMTWKDGLTYFFKDDYYWTLDNNRVEATSDSPRLSTREWLGCP